MTTKPKTSRKSAVIDRVLELLKAGQPMTQGEIGKAIESSSSAVFAALKSHRLAGGVPRVCVIERRLLAQNGVFLPVYALGDGEDVPMPESMKARVARRAQTLGIGAPPLAAKTREECDAEDAEDTARAQSFRERASAHASACIAANLARLRPLAGNVWGVCAAQVGGL